MLFEANMGKIHTLAVHEYSRTRSIMGPSHGPSLGLLPCSFVFTFFLGLFYLHLLIIYSKYYGPL